MSVRVYVQRFTRKFIFDVLPGALASLVGALFFAHQWTQAPMRTEVARVTAQNEQIVTMMREEQSLMRAVLEREHEAARRLQPAVKDVPAVKDTKDKGKADADKLEASRGDVAKAEASTADTTATVPARRRAEPPREVVRAAAAPVAAASIASPPTVQPVAEAPAATLESGPLVAPQPEDGVITRIASIVAALTHQTMEAAGVRPLPGLVPNAPAISQLDAWPSGHVLDTNR